jgi:predicted heme/steroid binding protein
VKQNYPFSIAGKFLYAELPSYNNDSGTVYLIYNSEIIDKVSYLDSWHFGLLDNTDGVSLERIDPDGESSSQYNWHSAAEDVGFATPGRVNSQYRPAVSNGEVTFSSDIFSPDNDGYQDVLQIIYELTNSGMLGKAQIFDDRGRLVRTLFTNELLGTSGTFTWDGLTDQQVKSSIGVYVLVFEVFSTDGGVFFTKQKAFTLAGKL